MKIVSGGQTGADQIGLWVAREFGLATGGWMPKGWKTEDGPNQLLAEEFGLAESGSASYYPRTYANTRDSDGTVYFAHNWESAGCKATLKACSYYGKPTFLVDLNHPLIVKQMANWVDACGIKVLNVAGHRGSYLTVEQSEVIREYLRDLLKLYGYKQK